MTEAEKLAQRLDKLPFESEAAALIRSLDAQNKRMAEALRDCPTGYDDDGHRYDHGGFYSEWRSRHAQALRDAGVGESTEPKDLPG